MSLVNYYGDAPLLKYYFNYEYGMVRFENETDAQELQRSK